MSHEADVLGSRSSKSQRGFCYGSICLESETVGQHMNNSECNFSSSATSVQCGRVRPSWKQETFHFCRFCKCLNQRTDSQLALNIGYYDGNPFLLLFLRKQVLIITYFF